MIMEKENKIGLIWQKNNENHYTVEIYKKISIYCRFRIYRKMG